MAYNIPEHYTAWITITTPELDTDNLCQVDVITDECIGDPDDPRSWSSGGPVVFHAKTGLRADRLATTTDANDEAQTLLEAAGWKPSAGRWQWEDVPTGYIATVVHTSGSA